MPAGLRDELDLIPITLVFGFQGLDRSPNTEADSLRDGVALSDCEAIRFDEDSVRKDPGPTAYNPAVITGANVLGVHQWEPTPGVRKTVVVDDMGAGALARLMSVPSAGAATVLDTAIHNLHTVQNVARFGPVFCEGSSLGTKVLFLFTGLDRVRVWDGVAGATTIITTPPADWAATDGNTFNQPIGGVVYNNALWCWGNQNFPHTIYKSKNANHQDFTVGGTAQDGQAMVVYPGVGSGIIAAAVFLDRLWILKYPVGIFYLDDTDLDPANWRWVRRSGNVGTFSPRLIQVMDEDGIFLGSSGLLHVMSAVTPSGDPLSSAILVNELGPDFSSRIPRTLNAFGQIDWQFMLSTAYVSATREWHLSFVEINGAVATPKRLTVDFRYRKRPRAHWTIRETVNGMAVGLDGLLYLATQEGTLWTLGRTEVYSKNGAGYTSSATTRQFALLGGERRGNLHRIDVVHRHRNAGIPFGCTVSVTLDDAVEQPAKTVTFGPETRAVGSHVSSARVYGDGYRATVTVSSPTAGREMSIEKIVLWVSPGSRRPL